MNKEIVKAVKALRSLSYEDFKLATSLARPDRPRRGRKPGPKPGSRRVKAVAAPAPIKRRVRITAEQPQANA